MQCSGCSAVQHTAGRALSHSCQDPPTHSMENPERWDTVEMSSAMLYTDLSASQVRLVHHALLYTVAQDSALDICWTSAPWLCIFVVIPPFFLKSICPSHEWELRKCRSFFLSFFVFLSTDWLVISQVSSSYSWIDWWLKRRRRCEAWNGPRIALFK